MNDPTNQDVSRLKQMLEEITAADSTTAGDSTSARGDADSASLREAWLAFGQLIRAADATLPAMPNLTPAEPKMEMPVRPQKLGRVGWLSAITAAAAAIFIAV